jgi:hypothetical protein
VEDRLLGSLYVSEVLASAGLKDGNEPAACENPTAEMRRNVGKVQKKPLQLQ